MSWVYIQPDYESGAPGGYFDIDTGQISSAPPAGQTQQYDSGTQTYADGTNRYVNLNDAGDLANLRQNYTQLMAHPEWSDEQVRQYVRQATGGGNFQLGSNGPGLTSKVDNSQFMGGLGPLLPLIAMGIATGGAGFGLGGLLEGGTLAGDAFLPGALGADGLGAGTLGAFGAGGTLPAWAGGVPESLTLGGGAAGTGLGGASLAGGGLTTAEGIGSGFAAGGGAFGGAGVDVASTPFTFSGGGAGPTSQNLIQQLQQMGMNPQQAIQAAQRLMASGGSGGATIDNATGQVINGGGAGGGTFNPLGLLGIGSGLNTMFNSTPAVDPNMVKALWQAGMNTYNTSLDPQGALYSRNMQQTVDAARAGQSARGIAASPFAAGLEDKAVRDFNLDWNDRQLARQAQGSQAFAQAGQVGANAGVANAAQQFSQNQTGLNNLTTGAQTAFPNLFGGGTNGGQQTLPANWLQNWWGNGFTPSTGTPTPAGGTYNPFPALAPVTDNAQQFGAGVTGGYSTPTQMYQNPWLDYTQAPAQSGFNSNNDYAQWIS